MGRISSAQMTEKNPAAWAEGTANARAARENIAAQFHKLLLDADLTGSRSYVARRVSEYAEASRSGDPDAERAALMELSVAAGATAAAIDLGQPPRQLPAAA